MWNSTYRTFPSLSNTTYSQKSSTRDKRPATTWSASLASTSGREFAQSGNYSQGIGLIGTAQRIRRITKISIFSISNPQEFLPLAIVALEAHALRDSED
jgi:hypothetical protein